MTDVEITYIPIFLSGLMKACGNTAPINIKNKDKWINQTRNRWSELFSIPMLHDSPAGFPPNTLMIMRALAALTVLKPGKEGQELLVRVLDVLFSAYWVEGKATAEKEVFSAILGGVLGEEIWGLVLNMLPKEGKETLLRNADAAFKDGAFGLPWFVVVNEKGERDTFWGVDHLGLVVRHLGLERPGSGGWKAFVVRFLGEGV
ncbi:hypothetical protein HYALB_00013941 [Hymenoscyphus albidus]|uniref:DSBA-like thioredoxin domain-containing protein n=1 Tax=Hymenoscyphus albidus TaxID=595503 RepID=A0A9N9Q6E3_9HELO|nr:hypothetical protein HYALB_00013941 [Hymenoscyphus albidus]